MADARHGLAVAHALADSGAGQTVVLRRGVVTALEAAEGTTETIRRGCALAGDGAVIVKAVAASHDYRFDAPAIGPETVDAAARGGATVIAVSADREHRACGSVSRGVIAAEMDREVRLTH